MATLQSVIDRAISAAVAKGLSSSKRISVVYVIGGAEIMLVVSFNEPSSVEAPLNLVWVNGDPSHADFKKARKRASRVANNGFQHTWSAVTEYSELSNQFWDTPIPDDNDHNLHDATIGNAHFMVPEDMGALPIAGGQMTGPLLLKPGSTLPDIANTEATPRWWVTLLVAPIQTLATQVRGAQAGMLTQVNSLRNRVTILENRLAPKGFIHTQTEPETEWVVEHRLNSVNMNISIYDSEGNMMLTDIFHFDENAVLVKFAVPTAGRANLQAIGV